MSLNLSSDNQKAQPVSSIGGNKNLNIDLFKLEKFLNSKKDDNDLK